MPARGLGTRAEGAKIMNKDTRNYYERELDEVDFTGAHPAKMLIGSEGKTTKTLDINKESAAALVKKLLDVFLHVAQPPEVVERAAHLPHFNMKLARDVNGNKVVRVCGACGRGFSIQTLGNLPATHCRGITSDSAEEIRDWVKCWGTKRQQNIVLGI